MIETSIFLTSYDRPNQTKKCLPAIRKQCDDSVEIILCDDYHQSSLELATFCAGLGVRYVHTGKQKQGKNMWRVPGFALNIGFQQSLGRNIIFGNSEILLVDESTISKMVTEINARAICSPRILGEGTSEFLNCKLPFFLGMPRGIFSAIGGYDEDMTGYCFDDNDFSDRALTRGVFKELDVVAVHLHNERGALARKDSFIDNRAWEFNRAIYEQRKDVLVRNKDRAWGQLDKEYVR